MYAINVKQVLKIYILILYNKITLIIEKLVHVSGKVCVDECAVTQFIELGKCLDCTLYMVSCSACTSANNCVKCSNSIHI